MIIELCKWTLRLLYNFYRIYLLLYDPLALFIYVLLIKYALQFLFRSPKLHKFDFFFWKLKLFVLKLHILTIIETT